jgi:hypothetical protein
LHGCRWTDRINWSHRCEPKLPKLLETVGIFVRIVAVEGACLAGIKAILDS